MLCSHTLHIFALPGSASEPIAGRVASLGQCVHSLPILQSAPDIGIFAAYDESTLIYLATQ